MKRKLRKIEAIILAISLVIGVFSGLTLNKKVTYAMTTQDTAVQWARSQEGNMIDVDENGAWCVDLIHAYCDYLGAGKIWGNANVYPSAQTPNGFTKIKGASIQPGDVVMWTGGEYGHVAIALSESEIIDQAGSGWPGACTIRRMFYNYGYWGVLRPNFISQPSAPSGERGRRMETGGPRTIANGDYHIVPALDTSEASIWRQCITIVGNPASRENGANAQLYGCIDRDDQVFTVTWRGNGFYEIKLKYSGKCLDVNGGDTLNGTNVQQWDDVDSDAQQWMISEADDGVGHIVQARCSGYYLDVTDAVCKNETNIRVCRYVHANNHAQQWLFIPWGGGDSARQEVPDGEYEIVTKVNSNKSVHALNNGKAKGTNIVLNDRGGNNRTTFNIHYLGKGYYTIIEKNSGLSLDITKGSSKKEANVELWEYNAGDHQQWLFKPCGDGSYNIISKKATYLDLHNSQTANGTNITMYDGNSTGMNQSWYLVPVENKPEPDNEEKPSVETPKPDSEVGPSTETPKPGSEVGPSKETPKPGNETKPSTEATKPGSEVKPSTETPEPGNETKPSTETPKPGSETRPSTETPKPGSETRPSTETSKPGSETRPSTETPKPGSETRPSTETSKPGSETKPSTGTPKPGSETKPSTETSKPGSEAKPSTETSKPGSEGNSSTGTLPTETLKPGEEADPSTEETTNPTDTEIPGTSDITDDNYSFDEDDDWEFDDDIFNNDDDEEDENNDNQDSGEFYNVEWNVSFAAIQVGKSTAKVKAVSENDKIVKYITSNAAVATVSSKGIITAKGIGNAVIRAITEHGCTADVRIKVQKKAVTTKKLTVKKRNVRLKVGKVYSLGAQATPVTSAQRIKYKSSKPKVVAVNSKGQIKAKKSGKAVITVRSGKKTVKVKVIVKR